MMRKTLFIVVMGVFSILSASEKSTASADTAHIKYTEGERAKTKPEREVLFNEALSAYLAVDTPTAPLYYNIGNCYFQLGEYGLAILYYNRALKENPRFEKAKGNLLVAGTKIGLTASPPHSYLPLSLQEQKYLYLGLIAFAFIIYSLHLWMGHPFFFRIASTALILSCLLFCNILWIHSLKPLEAVVIKPTTLRKDAGTQYASVTTKEPLYGEKVRVLEIVQDGAWLKVRVPSGEEGYISKEQARII